MFCSKFVRSCLFLFPCLLTGLCDIKNIRNKKSRFLPIIFCKEYLKQGNPELKNVSRTEHASSIEKNLVLKFLIVAPLGDKV